jgi:hypothetical protein
MYFEKAKSHKLIEMSEDGPPLSASAVKFDQWITDTNLSTYSPELAASV